MSFLFFYIDFPVLLQISFHKPTRNSSRDLPVSGALSQEPHRLSARSFPALPQPLVGSLKAARVHFPALAFARLDADSPAAHYRRENATANGGKV